MIQTVFIVCGVIITFSMAAVLVRIMKGPSVADRVVGLDGIGVMLMALIGILAVLVKSTLFIDTVVLLAILSFVGTISFAKFLEKGELIDRDDD